MAAFTRGASMASFSRRPISVLLLLASTAFAQLRGLQQDKRPWTPGDTNQVSIQGPWITGGCWDA